MIICFSNLNLPMSDFHALRNELLSEKFSSSSGDGNPSKALSEVVGRLKLMSVDKTTARDAIAHHLRAVGEVKKNEILLEVLSEEVAQRKPRKKWRCLTAFS